MKKRTLTNIARNNRRRGHKAQKQVAAIFLEMAKEHKLDLDEKDIFERQGSCNGTDIIMSRKAEQLFPFAIEVKMSKKFPIIDNYKHFYLHIHHYAYYILKQDIYVCYLKDFIDAFLKNKIPLLTVDAVNYPSNAQLDKFWEQTISNTDPMLHPLLVLTQDRCKEPICLFKLT